MAIAPTQSTLCKRFEPRLKLVLNGVALCDTNGGTLPERVTEVVQAAQAQGTQAKLGIHCHNDGDLATANSLAAVDAGCDQVQGTINGIGERCGNADLINIMANLALKKKGFQVLQGRSWTI